MRKKTVTIEAKRNRPYTKSFRTKKPGQTTSAERIKKCTKDALSERPGIRERKTGRKLNQAVTNLFCQEDIIMKKKVLAVLLGGCMVVGMLAGCGSKADNTKTADDGDKKEASGDSKGYHFEVVVKSFQSSYWQAAVQGINQACDELGVTANTTGPNAESDIADQVNMLNNAINQNPDGIALAACDQNSVIDSLKTALDKKIPVVCFDSGVPDAPEGSVYATVVTDNQQAGGIAAEHIYEAIKDRLGNGQVRVGEVNQDATSANISERGMGFINKFMELAKADNFTVAVIGNDFYVNQVKDNGDQASADIILEVAVPAQTTVELCATEASNIMNKDDTIAMFGSNQVSAEGVLTANQNLNKLGTGADQIVSAGFDAGSVIKAAVKDGTLLGAVTQSPLMQGKISIETLNDICDGKEVKDVTTDGYWYDSTNMDDADISPNLYD